MSWDIKNQKMKHLLSTITILFILLTSTVSWGSVDDKGVICDDDVGFYFDDGQVEQYFVKKINDSYEVFIRKHGKFWTTEDKISWNFRDFLHELNRETLVLSIHVGENLGTEDYLCRLVPWIQLLTKLHDKKNQLQKSLENKLRKNKI